MATIRDIAKLSGVSYPTVSHVLNHRRNVSVKTQQKVFDAIDQLGYIPNAVARGFSQKRMNTLGIVASCQLSSLFDDHCHGPIIESALLAAQDYDQACIVHFAKSFPEKVERLSLYCDGRCDGLLLVGQPTNSAVVAALTRRSFPFVCITEAELGANVPYVDADQVGMAEVLAQHLLKLGHRKFVVLCGNAESIHVPQRAEGFRRAFTTWHIAPSDAVFLPGTYDPSSASARIRRHLSETGRDRWPSAILCMNDFLALEVISTLRELGLRCPDDISVAGIDDARPSALSHPPLTTMRLPLKDLGQRAVQMLLRIIDGESSAPCGLNLRAELIERGSCKDLQAYAKRLQ
jgi:LacI family transcriptional regulator